MKPLPLRTSLTVVVTTLLAVVLTLLGVGYHSAVVRHLQDEATNQLDETVRGLRGLLQFELGEPVLVYDEQDRDARAFVAQITRYYRIYNATTGRLLVQSPGLEAFALEYTPADVAVVRRDPVPKDLSTSHGRIRIASAVIEPRPGEAYLLQVGEPLARLDAVLAEFDRLLFWRTIVGLIVAAVAGRLLAARTLRPLADVADTSTTIGITSLHERLPLRGTGDELDQLVAAFNRALARVEASVSEMRQFSAALAHELRTPLAILRGEAELALRQPTISEEEQKRLASQIDEFDRLTRLINQILTLARAEVGELPVAQDAVNLSGLAASVVDQIELVASARTITLTCAAPDPVIVTGDAGWLQRLLLLLLDNAVTFTPVGGQVSVRVFRQHARACVSVTDTGVGISREFLPRVFTRFSRADESRSSQTSGAGLGLALAKWIAERHGGVITVVSQLGNGSTFTVSLPPREGWSVDRGTSTGTATEETGASGGTREND